MLLVSGNWPCFIIIAWRKDLHWLMLAQNGFAWWTMLLLSSLASINESDKISENENHHLLAGGQSSIGCNWKRNLFTPDLAPIFIWIFVHFDHSMSKSISNINDPLLLASCSLLLLLLFVILDAWFRILAPFTNGESKFIGNDFSLSLEYRKKSSSTNHLFVERLVIYLFIFYYFVPFVVFSLQCSWIHLVRFDCSLALYMPVSNASNNGNGRVMEFQFEFEWTKAKQ